MRIFLFPPVPVFVGAFLERRFYRSPKSALVFYYLYLPPFCYGYLQFSMDFLLVDRYRWTDCFVVLDKCLSVWRFMDNVNGFLHVSLWWQLTMSCTFPSMVWRGRHLKLLSSSTASMLIIVLYIHSWLHLFVLNVSKALKKSFESSQSSQVTL